ncbi:diguanylate cyclase (GGDEF)-like protein/PAS domain S-box-containing protein [Inquilinus ginsengisoli]|uniref:Diguanylate cyclase (GGDEF)-like protein/PAS domain S-box-containing protein n=1 Tax=Inquilinus ginsengisoli TaxID=363840 RepID=A0ABU1JQX5_9PROT|nr:PAS domain-containing protein [Inquilinus ginsengisoli]MDR6291021.1 diguanylate cyclase (GGDEF)-like protein/PAS domain S-box-containing protein [Inquilinus ginsengisoli]
MGDAAGRPRKGKRFPAGGDLSRHIVDHAAVSMAVAGGDGRCLHANPAFCAMFGFTLEDCIGRTVGDIVHPDDRAAVLHAFDALRRGQIETARAERRYLRQDGGVFWGMAHVSALRDMAGAPSLYIYQIVDIGPKKRAEADLLANERRWNFALGSAGQGVWDWDVESGRIWRSRQCRAMLGFREAEIDEVGDRWWRRRLHPDDVGRVLAAFDDLAGGRDQIYDTDYRLRHRDGRWVWILARGKVVERRPDGRPRRMVGTNTDITRQKEIEEQLAMVSERLELAVKAGRIGVWDLDLVTDMYNLNAEMHEIYGLGQEGMRAGVAPGAYGGTMAEAFALIHPDDVAKVSEDWQRALGQTSAYEGEFRIRRPTGELRHIYSVAQVQRDPAGKARRGIGINLDITEQREAAARVAALNERLELALEVGSVGIFDFDFATEHYSWDGRMYELYDLSPGTYDGTLAMWIGFLHPDDIPKVMREYEIAVQETSVFSIDFRIRAQRTGGIRHIRSLARVIRRPDGSPLRAVGMNWDITDHRDLAEALFEEKERLRITLHSIGDAVISTDAEARITFMNPVAEQLTGWPAAEAMGRPLPDVFRIVDEASGEVIADPVSICLERMQPLYVSDGAILVGRGGERRNIRDSAAPVRTASGEIIGAVLVFQDVTRDRTLQQALAHSASHDSLTGLPNRMAFEHGLREAVEQVRRGEGREHVLCCIDLDRFKIVNDGAGHAAGDALLRDVANLLRRRCRAEDLVARLGGDEFALLLRDCSVGDGVTAARQVIRAVAGLRFVWDDKSYHIGASIGLTVVAADGGRPDELMSQADIACYTAKTAGRGRVSIYGGDGSAARRHHREIQIAAGIRNAIETNRFRLYAQEIRSLGPNPVPMSHIEILLRMQDDDGNIVEPVDFIPASERYDLMGSIDRWVIRTTLRDHGPNLRAAPGLSIAINLSANSLNDPFLWPFLKEELFVSGLNPGRLHLEITETAMINNLGAAGQFVTRARAAGCRVVLDDFGTGLSSFSYLRQFPVDGVKIDGGFIRQVAGSAVDRAIVESINAIGHRLGAITTAEHVEDAETLEIVRAMGIDQAQGYAVARPQPLDTVI